MAGRKPATTDVKGDGRAVGAASAYHGICLFIMPIWNLLRSDETAWSRFQLADDHRLDARFAGGLGMAACADCELIFGGTAAEVVRQWNEHLVEVTP